MKQRTHNEWFQPVSKQAYGKGSTCPCGRNKAARAALGDASLYSWGEYTAARWRCVDYMCIGCFAERTIPRLRSHANTCGCTFAVCARSGYSLPVWLRLPDNFQVCAA